MPFATSIEQILTKDEIKEFLKEEKMFYIEYAEENWLNRYHKVKMMSKKTHVPHITSRLSHTPPSQTNEFHSSTETYAMKRIQASEWLELFHEKLNQLNEQQQKLIKLKYIDYKSDRSDSEVYPELFLSRKKYYDLKQEALENLGRMLYGSLDD